jgi:hypothetical protein
MNRDFHHPVGPGPLTFQELWDAGWIQGTILVGAVLAAVACAYLAPL